MVAHIPHQLLYKCNKAAKIDKHLILHPDEAVNMYRLNGGRITDPEDTAADPLSNNFEKAELRFQAFVERFPSFDVIFYSIANETPSVFEDALLFFIDLTYRLSHS